MEQRGEKKGDIDRDEISPLITQGNAKVNTTRRCNQIKVINCNPGDARTMMQTYYLQSLRGERKTNKRSISPPFCPEREL